MSSGYIYLETHPEHPAHVRLLQNQSKPNFEQASEGARIRYIARLNSIFRGHQQVVGQLSHQIIDADQGLFRIDLLGAIAKVETAALSGERIWIDPEMSATDIEQLDQEINEINQRRQRIDWIWKAVGFAFVALLALRALSGW